MGKRGKSYCWLTPCGADYPPASRRRTVMIQVGGVPDLSSRTDRINPVMDASPTFSVLLAPLNCAIRHRLASVGSFVSSVCIRRYPSKCPVSANWFISATADLRGCRRTTDFHVKLLVAAQVGTTCRVEIAAGWFHKRQHRSNTARCSGDPCGSERPAPLSK